MNCIKQFCGVVSAVAFLVLSLTAIAKAQDTEKYVNVGSDSDGDPFLLDTEKMGYPVPGFFGTLIKVYQIKNGLMTELLLNPACGDNQLKIVGSRTYSNGTKITENRHREEIGFRPNTPSGEAMRYYCRSINARGW